MGRFVFILSVLLLLRPALTHAEDRFPLPGMISRWEGEAKIMVTWCKQHKLSLSLRARARITWHFAAGPQARWRDASDELYSRWHVRSEQQSQRACGPQPERARRRVGICFVAAPRRCTLTSPASRRLASAHPALAPKCQLILARALRILSDGEVGGRIGDATVENGRIKRNAKILVWLADHLPVSLKSMSRIPPETDRIGSPFIFSIYDFCFRAF
jgi:hypothetical protein